jgi:SmpA / OmlA family
VRKRLLILAGVALALAVLVPAALHLHAYRQMLARGRLIDREHYDRITEGMSRAEVEDILGGPPGDFSTGGDVYSTSYSISDGPAPTRRGPWESWYGNEGVIFVGFDEQGRVRERRFGSPMRPPLTYRLRAWLRRYWP